MFNKIRARYYLKSKEMIKTHTCFLNLKLNSHIGSCLFPTIFLHQKSKHLEFFNILEVLFGMAGFLEIRAADGSYMWSRDRITHA